MSDREIVSDEVADPTKFGSPTSNAVRAGDFIYISGMMPWDKDRRVVGIGDIKAQTRQVLKNMDAMLRAAGGSLKNVVKINFFLTDIRDKAAIWDVRKEMFGQAIGKGFLPDTHCPTGAPRESIVKISKAEPGGMEGVGLWRPAAQGLRPRYESPAMRRFLDGDYFDGNEA
jgi:enamine deaminase RidA (YjgF/YER057c/UK114 family)